MTFGFDDIFGEEKKNKEIFQKAFIPILNDLNKGINSTILTYGITGSGKTYTMIGDISSTSIVDQEGLVQLSLNYILDNKTNDMKILFSYYELYNENLIDLLKKSKKLLPNLSNLEQIELKKKEDLKILLLEGNKNRSTASTSSIS